MVNRASQEYWNSEYRSFGLHIAKEKDAIRRWIESHVAPAGSANRTCLEIGCHPGRFMAVFGELGYELFGIDFAADLATLPAWLKRCGYAVPLCSTAAQRPGGTLPRRAPAADTSLIFLIIFPPRR
jgi:hypothetical protein